MRSVLTTLIAAVLSVGVAASAQAQQREVEAHFNGARTTQSHQRAWGGGAQYQLTWGDQRAPVRLGTSVAADYQKQEHGGSSQTSGSLDLTLQPGGGGSLTPYVGGSAGANHLSGGGTPSTTQLGLQYIVGLQVKPQTSGPLAVRVELRPGYVRTQEHSVTLRLGVSSSL